MQSPYVLFISKLDFLMGLIVIGGVRVRAGALAVLLSEALLPVLNKPIKQVK